MAHEHVYVRYPAYSETYVKCTILRKGAKNSRVLPRATEPHNIPRYKLDQDGSLLVSNENIFHHNPAIKKASQDYSYLQVTPPPVRVDPTPAIVTTLKEVLPTLADQISANTLEVSNTSHQFKTPLSSMSTFLHGLRNLNVQLLGHPTVFEVKIDSSGSLTEIGRDLVDLGPDQEYHQYREVYYPSKVRFDRGPINN